MVLVTEMTINNSSTLKLIPEGIAAFSIKYSKKKTVVKHIEQKEHGIR